MFALFRHSIICRFYAPYVSIVIRAYMIENKSMFLAFQYDAMKTDIPVTHKDVSRNLLSIIEVITSLTKTTNREIKRTASYDRKTLHLVL